jgi:hypothetical protein
VVVPGGYRDAIERLAHAGLGDASHTKYAAAFRKFQAFGLRRGWGPLLNGSVDSQVDGICQWLAAGHAGELGKWGPDTLFQSLSGISYYHKLAGVELPLDHFKIGMVKKGIRREHAARCKTIGAPVKKLKRRALSWEILMNGAGCVELWQSVGDQMTLQVLKLSYILMARASELFAGSDGKVHEIYGLTRECLSFFLKDRGLVWKERERADRVQVTFKGSKNDQYGRIGASLQFEGEALDTILHLLSLHRSLPASSPLAAYVDSDGVVRVVTREAGVRKLRQMIRALNIDSPEQFALHSGRIGGATKLYAAGAIDRYIQKAGRWRSLAFMEYLRDSVPEGLKVSAMLMS